MTDTQRAYIAGLFDGEGSVGLYFKTRQNCFVLQVSVYNCNYAVMNWLKVNVPYGSISKNSGGDKSNHILWMWGCSSQQAKNFLSEIRPYLVIKAEQVDLLFSLWEAEQKVQKLDDRGKLSSELFALRQETVIELKRLKTSAYQRLS